MARKLRRPRDPEALTHTVLALREIAGGGSGRTPFETGLVQVIKGLGLTKASAKNLVGNFDRIRPKDRERLLGRQGLANARPPQRVSPRNLATATTQGVSQPGLLRDRGGLAIGDQVPAPVRYGVRYQGMHCVDETHADWAGSDTIYIITSAAHIKPEGTNVVNTVRHPIDEPGKDKKYHDVDSGETRRGPVASCWSQLVADTDGGVSITTAVFEADKGDPDYYRDQVDKTVKLALAIVTYLYPGLGGIAALIAKSGLLTDFFNWLLSTGDDLIGEQTVVLRMEDLEDYGRSRVDPTYAQGSWLKFNLPYHFVASVNSNDYFAAFTVKRDPDAPYPDPVVE